MSSGGIAPVPTSLVPTASDRPPHRDAHRHQQTEAETPAAREPAVEARVAPVAPVGAAPETASESLFEASQFAARLKLLEMNLRELSRQSGTWSPPTSQLSLTDKTI